MNIHAQMKGHEGHTGRNSAFAGFTRETSWGEAQSPALESNIFGNGVMVVMMGERGGANVTAISGRFLENKHGT